MSALEPRPIASDEFHQALFDEHDGVLVRVRADLYYAPAYCCGECRAASRALFASSEAGLTDAVALAESEYAMLREEIAWGSPGVGVFVCLDCRNVFGSDLRDCSIRVLEPEDYRQYAEFRGERGDPA